MIKILQLKEKNISVLLFFLNFSSFLIKFIGGLNSNSLAIMSHSYDMFIDALVSGISLWAIGRENKTKEKIALIKGFLFFLFGITTICSAFKNFGESTLPNPTELGFYSFLSILINIASIFLIFRSRNESILLKTSWFACRNDFLVNLILLIDAGIIHKAVSNFPDLIISGFIGYIFISSFLETVVDLVKSGFLNLNFRSKNA